MTPQQRMSDLSVRFYSLFQDRFIHAFAPAFLGGAYRQPRVRRRMMVASMCIVSRIK